MGRHYIPFQQTNISTLLGEDPKEIIALGSKNAVTKVNSKDDFTQFFTTPYINVHMYIDGFSICGFDYSLHTYIKKSLSIYIMFIHVRFLNHGCKWKS